ncbi:MAG: type II toxin-antitoxin system RelE/ParE family toxin [Candidatus Peregrinibacteria bacterium]
MKYQIEVSKEVKKFLKKHPEVIFRFFRITNFLEDDPYSPLVDIKNLQGEENKYRFRIGKYRFLYEVEDQVLLIYIYDADSRGSIYK